MQAKRAICTSIVVAFFTLLPLSTAALAQSYIGQTNSDEAASAGQPTAAGAPAAATPAPQELTEVQVTGTRIVREGYEAPTPVTALGLQNLQDAAQVNIADTLAELPVFQGNSTNQNSTLGDTQGDQTELNLRNLGANRTLVLFEGRRLPAANTEEVPDESLIPDALVQRVDVVTGGASAVYGSDAVAGVVNYVLDTNFTGIKGLVQGGVGGYGDGSSDKVQLTMGTAFADGRLHLLLSGEQDYQAEIPGTDRPWNIAGESGTENPAYKAGGTQPEYLLEPCCVSKPGYDPGGIVLSGPLAGTDFGAGGAVGQYAYGFGEGSSNPGASDFGGSWQETQEAGVTDILAAVSATHAFARLGFDIAPDTQVFAEFINGQNHTSDRCCPDYYPTGVGTVSVSNPYLPASVVARAAAAGVTTLTIGDTIYPNTGVENGIGTRDDRTQDIYVLGLKGKLAIGKSTYNWNIYGQQGIAVLNLTSPGNANSANLARAIQAVKVGSYGPGYTAAAYPNPLGIAAGTITCSSNLLPLAAAGETNNCVPYNLFGVGVASQAATNYITGTPWERAIETETMVGGDITGEPFSTWAGPVSVALDAEHRREAIDGNGDTLSLQKGWFSVNYFPFNASEYVNEGALETVVPLLKDVPGVEELDANGAVRGTDYSTSGYVTTYKYGLEYTPIHDLRFRATESMDIRAPNLSNLFGYSTGHGQVQDPAEGNIDANATTITAGNTQLRPEKAHTTEIGLVFQPSELPGLNVSVDFYRIKLDGAISTLTAFFELDQCYLNPQSQFCALIVRNPNNTLVSVTVVPINIATYLAQGVDYAADYRKQLTEIVSSWKGAVQLHFNATNTQHVITNTGIAGPTQILEGAGVQNSPRWAVFGTLSYDLDPWRFVWTERYDSSVLASNIYIQCSNNCPTTIPSGFTTIGYSPRIPTYFLANLSVQYKFMQHDQQEAEAFINVNNILNKQPPFARSIQDYGFDQYINYYLYDRIGLYATAGIRFRF